MTHLDRRANIEAAALAAATILIYLFIYTPLKQRSSLNTLVGAVAGALPPLIGWVSAAGGPSSKGFRWELLAAPEAVFLFTLLFLWQMPHFLAINWMFRAEYVRAGFVMWSNDDESGARTSALSLFFSALLVPLMSVPAWTGFARAWFAVAGLLLTGMLLWLAWEFYGKRSRLAARKLFFATLLFLPAVLLLLLIAAQ
ncbi:MAG: UbiA family prenyltransferase [Verrucomicrobiales bacterium]